MEEKNKEKRLQVIPCIGRYSAIKKINCLSIISGTNALFIAKITRGFWYLE